MEIIPSVIVALAALLVSIFSFWIGYWTEERKRKREAPTLKDKATTLIKSLKESLSAISEIEAEVEKRGKLVEKLENDVQRYEQLKELNKAQVEAVAQTIRGEVAGESKKSLWRNAIITFIVALIFFSLGFWLRGV